MMTFGQPVKLCTCNHSFTTGCSVDSPAVRVGYLSLQRMTLRLEPRPDTGKLYVSEFVAAYNVRVEQQRASIPFPIRREEVRHIEATLDGTRVTPKWSGRFLEIEASGPRRVRLELRIHLKDGASGRIDSGCDSRFRQLPARDSQLQHPPRPAKYEFPVA